MVWKKAKDIVTDLAESLPKDAADKGIDKLKRLLPKKSHSKKRLSKKRLVKKRQSKKHRAKKRSIKIGIPPKPNIARLLGKTTGLIPAKKAKILGIIGSGTNLSEKVLQKWQGLPSISAGAIAATLTGDDFRAMMTETFKSWAENTLGKVPDAYDRALDATYNADHVGGKFHRLFDDSHDPMGAWQKISKAGLGDSMNERVIGYTQALTKDFVTTMGLPFATIDKASFEHMVDVWSAIPGVDREYLYRFFTMNAADIVSTSLSSAGMVLNLRRENYQRLSEYVGAVGVSAIANANPVLAMITICCAGYAFSIEQLSFGAMGVGATGAVISILLGSVLSLSVLIEFILVSCISSAVKVKILENKKLHSYLIERMASTRGRLLHTFG